MDWIRLGQIRAMVVGPSSSGKTTLVAELILNSSLIFSITFDKIVISYEILDPTWERLAQILPNVTLIQYLPLDFLAALEARGRASEKTLVVLDDQLINISKNPEPINKLFTMGSSKLGVSVMLLTQNMYFPQFRTISLQVNLYILMRTIRAEDQIKRLAGSMGAEEKKHIMQSYRAAMKLKPYNHFVIDLGQDTPEYLRYYTGLTVGDPRIYFVPDKEPVPNVRQPKPIPVFRAAPSNA